MIKLSHFLSIDDISRQNLSCEVKIYGFYYLKLNVYCFLQENRPIYMLQCELWLVNRHCWQSVVLTVRRNCEHNRLRCNILLFFRRRGSLICWLFLRRFLWHKLTASTVWQQYYHTFHQPLLSWHGLLTIVVMTWFIGLLTIGRFCRSAKLRLWKSADCHLSDIIFTSAGNRNIRTQ